MIYAHYWLCCAVILQKIEGYMNMYGHILYIIIYCLRDYYVL